MGLGCIVGALTNLGHTRVGPDGRQYSKTAWDRSRAAAQAHYPLAQLHSATMDVLARTDFFTVEVLTLKGFTLKRLVTYYVLFFIHLETRRVCLAGITPYPDQQWIKQQARNVTMKDWGFLAQSRYLLHYRDGKFCPGFREVIKGGKVRPLKLPARSPNLNAFAERWVRSVKEECLSRLILFGEDSLRRALTQYSERYHQKPNHQSKANQLLFPSPRRPDQRRPQGAIRCRERLGGLLKYYERRAS